MAGRAVFRLATSAEFCLAIDKGNASRPKRFVLLARKPDAAAGGWRVQGGATEHQRQALR